MSIRAGYEIPDIQEAIVAFLRAKVTSGGPPWTSWTIVEGWPDKQVFENFAKSFLYCHAPLVYGEINQQGGEAGLVRWEVVIGGWTDRQKGGTEEAGIMMAELFKLFRTASINNTTFSGSIAGTAFVNKTFPQIGITIESVINPRKIEIYEDDDFRGEVSVILTA